MNYLPLYICSIILPIFCLLLLHALHKMGLLNKRIQELELLHTQRYNRLEQLIKKDVTSIITILKNHYEQNLNMGRKEPD